MIKYYVSPVVRRWQEKDNGTKHSWNSTWREYFKKNPQGTTIQICAELVFAGSHTYRISEKPIEIQNGSETYFYHGTMLSVPDITHSVDPSTNSTSTLRSFSFEALITEYLLDIAKMGYIVAGFGEVFLIVEGMAYQDRYVLMRGEMIEGLQFGSEGEPVNITLSDPSYNQEVTIPPYILTEETIDSQARYGVDLEESAIGIRYPMVLTSTIALPITQIAKVTTQPNVFRRYYLVCYGHDVIVDSLWFNGTRFGILANTSSIVPIYDHDEFGRPITILEIDSMINDDTEAQNLHVGIIPKEDRAFIEQIEYLVTNYSRVGMYGIQKAYFSLAQSKIPSFISAMLVINASGEGNTATAISYLESTLGAEFPMLKFFWYGDGYAVTVVDRTRNPYVGRFVVGQHPIIDRESAVSEESVSGKNNSFVIRYAYNAHLDAYGGVITRNPSNNMFCKMSEEQIGMKEAQILDSVTIPDMETATYVMDWLCAHNTLPSYRVSYICHNSFMFAARLGDNIYLTDSDLGWEDVQATIISISFQQTHCIVELCVWVLYSKLSGGAVSSFGVSIGGTIE